MAEQDNQNAVELVKLRNNFYRDHYRQVLAALLFALIAVAILTAVLAYTFVKRPEPRYFATTRDGRIIKLYPLNQPYLSSEAILSWATEAAMAAYSFDFLHYRTQLQKASSYFTPGGWREFLAALQSSNNLKTVEAKKLVVSAVANGAPVIQSQQVIDGRYTWNVQIPMLLIYQSSSDKQQSNIVITMKVVRVSTLTSAKGVGINSFVVQ